MKVGEETPLMELLVLVSGCGGAVQKRLIGLVIRRRCEYE